MGNAVDTTGLSFTVTKVDGTTASVSPQTHTPTTWGDTAGTQTCTFTYSDGYDSVSCVVEATVLAEEVSSIAISGTPSVQTEGATVDATGLTVTATYNSGRTTNVTSSATFTDYNTETSTVGSAISYDDGWEVARTKVRASYEGQTADSAFVNVVSANGPNTADTAYELESSANAIINLDARGLDTSALEYPYNGAEGGFLIEGASIGTLVAMYFSKDQWDNDTPVSISTFAGLIPLVGAKGTSDSSTPAYGDVFSVSNQSYTMTLALDGTAEGTLPQSTVNVIGYLANAVTAGGEGTIKKSDLVLTGENAAKVFYVDVVASQNNG